MAPNLLVQQGVSNPDKWLKDLELRFGVTREASAHLRPLLEQLFDQSVEPADRERLLKKVANAMQKPRAPGREPSPGQVQGLLGQFTSELQRMDETLKVLTVYLERLNKQLVRPEELRVLH